MPRGGIPKPVGYETVWKDRDGRTRTKVRVADGRDYGKDRNMIDKRIVVYLDNHKEETWKDLKGYCIIHLDNDTSNFEPSNLFKIKKEIYLLMLNNRMLFDSRELNESSILIATNMYLAKQKKEINGGIVMTYSKEYYEKNKEKIKENNKRYREKNVDKYRKYNREYMKEHPEIGQRAYEKMKEKVDWTSYCADRRKARVERLKAEGCLNPWGVVTKGAKPRYKKDV